MSEEFVGIVVSGSKLEAVHLEKEMDTYTLINQFTWNLQTGDAVVAYGSMFERVRDYVKNKQVKNVIIKGSAIGKNRPTLAHLRSAELRGVVCVAALVGGASTTFLQKAMLSRTFGDRKTDEYVKDDSYWKTAVAGDLTKGRREAALLVLSQGDT